STTGSRTASAPTSCSAGSRCCWPASSRPAPTPPGPAPATSCSACTWAPSPARPGCSARPAHPASRSAGCTPPSTSRCPRGSWTSPPSSPQRAEQEQHPRLVTRHDTRPTPICPAETPHSSTFTGRQLRNPGPASPGGPAADLVFVQAGQGLGGLEGFLDAPAGARDADQFGQRDRAGCVAAVVGQLAVLGVAADQQPAVPG